MESKKNPAMYTFVELEYNEQEYLRKYIQIRAEDNREAKKLLRIFSFLPLIMGVIALGTFVFGSFGFDFMMLIPVAFCVAIFLFLRMLATAEDEELVKTRELEKNNHGVWLDIVDAERHKWEVTDKADDRYYFWAIDDKNERYRYDVTSKMYGEWAKLKRANNDQNPEFSVLMVRN